MDGNTANGSTSPCPEDEITILVWEQGDPRNPYNFSKRRKRYIITVSILTILNATLGSALPSNIVSKLVEEWNIDSVYQETLPITVFIMGKCSREPHALLRLLIVLLTQDM